MTSVGVNPYLMGIVMIVNLGIGMITPPVGNFACMSPAA